MSERKEIELIQDIKGCIIRKKFYIQAVTIAVLERVTRLGMWLLGALKL